jgi:hypothetical protein
MVGGYLLGFPFVTPTVMGCSKNMFPLNLVTKWVTLYYYTVLGSLTMV